MASPEGGKPSGNIYAAPGSTEGSGVCLKRLYTNTHNRRNHQRWSAAIATISLWRPGEECPTVVFREGGLQAVQEG